MEWHYEPFKVIHWHVEKEKLSSSRFYLPEIKVNCAIHDLIGEPPGFRLITTWRFRLYDEEVKEAFLSFIMEHCFLLYKKENSNNEMELDRIIGTAQINVDLKLKEYVVANNLSPDIKYNRVFTLPPEQKKILLEALTQ